MTTATVQCANPECGLLIPRKGALLHPASGLHACNATCARAVDHYLTLESNPYNYMCRTRA
jgi:hypothetical protein